MRDYSFGNFLHELRERRGLSQYQLGMLVGVSNKAVSKWENGTAKPQSRILYKLSDVLGVTVDELLACKYRSAESGNEKGVFAMKNQLWKKTFQATRNRYGEFIPLEIMNLFLTEQAEMQGTDMIVYLDMLATLALEAKKQNEHIRVKGGTGASFVAFMLGATQVNPLKPHYYCPGCHAVIFDNSADDGWDLPSKQCSCGRAMIPDGHNIPFETYRHVVHRNTSFEVSISPSFFEKAKSIIKHYFKDCKLMLIERQDNSIVTFTVSAESADCSVTLCADAEFERYKALERATATAFDRIDFLRDEVLQNFKSGNTGGIPEFSTSFVKDVMSKVKPTSFRDLIQISGLSHGTGVWIDNAEELIKQGVPAGEMIAYRDDVFNYIQQHMFKNGFADTGFSYKIMEDTRRGLYAKNGVSDEIQEQLKSIGTDDWLVDSIEKIKYLFPKAHGVLYVKYALILMWYKINYPKEFKRIMLND